MHDEERRGAAKKSRGDEMKKVSQIASSIYQAAKKAATGAWDWKAEWKKAMKEAWAQIINKVKEAVGIMIDITKKIRKPKDYEMIINLDSALYIIRQSAYDNLMSSMMRDEDEIGDTPFGCLYEVDYEQIASSAYLSCLPVKSSPFAYISAKWSNY